ncbi:hypothetical protein [Neorhizobium sp. LjRoot104]|uniref:hypothetical protein n=1 Tax=Neorhizobium sp. LjRoot104 TaxID=3342254 RepID=UPI003ECD157C
MVTRKVGPVLAEILEAIDGIENHTAGKSLAEFEHDWLLRLGTQRAPEAIVFPQSAWSPAMRDPGRQDMAAESLYRENHDR